MIFFSVVSAILFLLLLVAIFRHAPQPTVQSELGEYDPDDGFELDLTEEDFDGDN